MKLKNMFSRTHLFLLILFLFSLIFLPYKYSNLQAQTSDISYYISPTGDDNNPGTESQPFKTLAKAQNTIRTINQTMASNIVIYLRGGTYTLDSTFLLEPQDSGMNGFSVMYKNYPGESPIISGGKPISGWTQEGNKWKAQVGTSVDTRQLYVNGVRAIRAKSTGGLAGGVKTAGGYTTTDMNMQNWGNKDKIEMVDNKAANEGSNDPGAKLFRCPVSTISGGTITMQNPCWSDSQLDPGVNATMGLPDWIENAYELLDSPGEWYLNRSTGWLYYMPRTGEDMTTATVVMPTVETLVRMAGTLDSPVHNIQFQGLTFSYATWLAPNTGRGNPDYWANVALRYVNGLYIGDLAVPAIDLNHAQAIRLERNIFTKLGGDGLGIKNGSQDSVIVGNRFYDISGNGLQASSGDNAGTDSREVTKNIQILNNYIHNIGTEYYSGVAISNQLVQGFNISHNEIYNVPSGGILIGWHTDTVPTYIGNNRVERNYIRDTMKTMVDGGSIYSANAQPGNVYAYNVIRNQKNNHGGLYLDVGSRYIELSNNVSVDNARNLFVNGGDHYIHDNWWQDRFPPYDLWYYILDFGPNRIENNHVITDISGAPAEIIANAGLEPAYVDIKNPPFGDTSSPNVAITYPLNNSTVTVRKTVTIKADASDNVGVASVKFYINNTLKCTDTTSPYSCNWLVPTRRGVNYVIKAEALDTAGNTSANSVLVTAR